MITIITEKNEWDFWIDSCVHSDFYHTYDYHQFSKNSKEDPILIKFSENGQIILLPLLIRKIEDTPYKDATSVYGYPGPLAVNNVYHFDYASFHSELHTLFLELKLVSVFSRLNPLIADQEIALNDFGKIETVGKVINIDLTKKPEDQERAYQRRLRTYINMSRRHCSVRKATTDEEVHEFIEMYYLNMQRVNAKPNYFFDRKYFFDLLKSDDFKAEILLATLQGTNEIVSGAMFIKRGKIVQYHLSGTKAEYLYLNPVKLIIDEMRIMASAENYSYFNLGGGLGSREDSLFNFKSSFSKDQKIFKVWKYIVNKDVYDKLVKEKQNRACANLHEYCSNFFPCYRCDI